MLSAFYRKRRAINELVDWLKPSSSLHARIRGNVNESKRATNRMREAKWRIWLKVSAYLRAQR